jgi:hypothetical protein
MADQFKTQEKYQNKRNKPKEKFPQKSSEYGFTDVPGKHLEDRKN